MIRLPSLFEESLADLDVMGWTRNVCNLMRTVNGNACLSVLVTEELK